MRTGEARAADDAAAHSCEGQQDAVAEGPLQQIAALRPDFIVVAAYGLILPKELLELPRFGCINIHASLLPDIAQTSSGWLSSDDTDVAGSFRRFSR